MDRELTGRNLAELALGIDVEQLSEAAVRRVVWSIRDCLAVAVAGAPEFGPAAVRSVVAARHRERGRTFVIGDAPNVPLWALPADAALCNGTSAHQLDYDDTARPHFGHLSAVLVPVLLALEDLAAVDGRALVASYVAGFEGSGRLAHKMNTAHYERGWHTTSTIGTIAAALTGSRLLNLSAEQATHAVGIAASAASGLRVNFGSDVKPLHAGYAARNGVLAVLLAREGMTADPGAISSRRGYLDLFDESRPVDNSGYPQPALLVETDWALVLKPFPSCGGTHAAIEAAQQLRDEIPLSQIESVEVRVNSLTPQAVTHTRPTTPLQAKFSMQFCVAAALCRGDIGLETFSPDALADRDIQALVPKVAMVEAPELRSDPEHPACVTIASTDGRRVSATVMRALGRAGRPMDGQKVWSKFADCVTRGGWVMEDARAVFDDLGNLPGWDANRRLAGVLTHRRT